MRFEVKRARVAIILAWGLFAGTAVASSQVGGVTINQLSIYSRPTGNDGVVVYFSPGIPNLEGCTNTAGNALYIDFSYTTQPDGKALYASLLAAELAGKAVTFGVSGCGASNQFPIIYRIDVVI
jgi:hypothetical protein